MEAVFCEYQYCLSYIEQLFYIILPLGLLYGFFFYYKFRRSSVLSPFVLRIWAIIVFCAGMMLYFVGFYHEGTQYSLLALILRSIMSSLELFVSHSDLLEVSDVCKESSIYMTCFALVQFNALFVSAALIFSLICRQFISGLLSFINEVKRNPISKLHIFWGVNENAIILINSIVLKPDDLLIVVNLPQSEKKNVGRLNFSRIFSSVDYDVERLDKIVHTQAIMLYASFDDVVDSREGFLKSYRLSRLCNYIGRADQTCVYFMGGDEKCNISCAQQFVDDKNVFQCKSRKEWNVKVYCSANRTKDNLIQEKFINMKKVSFTLIDSAYLAALSLKVAEKYSKEVCPVALYKEKIDNRIINREYANHPINFVRHENGAVNTCFTSMIVGFGATGQNVFNFLYEFGSFADNDRQKSPFKSYIFDDDIDRIWTHYVQQVPYFEEKTIYGNDVIKTFNCSPHSMSFWRQLYEIIDELNYVVISLGNDNENLSFLSELVDVVQHKRVNDLNTFHIVIRSYQKENEELLIKTIKTYNELWGDEIIRYFGMPSNIYTQNKIDDEELESLSSFLKDTYNKAKKKEKPQYNANSLPVADETPFEEEYAFLSKRRKDYANKEQGLHTYTKRILLGDNPTDEVIETVSVCEHLRWNASHYVQGYMPMTQRVYDMMPLKNGEKITCSEKYKQHLCLVPFSELSETYKNYDRVFVNDVIKLFAEMKE